MIRRKKCIRETEIDLKPFMNIIVTLIPVLILSAEFAKMSVVDISLPPRGGSPGIKDTIAPDDPNANKLLLTAIVTDSVITLGAKGGFLPSLFYKEFHRYVARDDHEAFTVEYIPKRKTLHPKSKREMSIYERNEILLYATDENRNIMHALYAKESNRMITDAQGTPIAAVKAGDTVYELTSPRIMTVVKSPSEFALQPLSVYDELKNRLMKIKERYSGAQDGNSITIAAENQVMYDKIIQLMDVARAAEFSNISIAKLRI